MDTATLMMAVLTAGSAVAAAVYAYRALSPSKAAVLSDWLSQFSGDEMGNAMGLLRAWQRQHGTACGDKYREAMEKAPVDEEARELLIARRRVSQFFKNLARLHRTGLIEDRLIAAAFGKRSFDFCLEVLDPLDQAHSQRALGEPDDPYWRSFYQRIRSKAYELDVV